MLEYKHTAEIIWFIFLCHSAVGSHKRRQWTKSNR